MENAVGNNATWDQYDNMFEAENNTRVNHVKLKLLLKYQKINNFL